MNSVKKILIVSFKKSVPLSLVKLKGQLYLLIMFSHQNIIAITDVQSLVGATSTHLIK